MSAEWTAGYVADIGYTHGYYPELNPLRLQLAFLHAGLAMPQTGTACELGFGQGVSVNLHAAAGVARWSGTDFNPSQAGFAQELSTASGVQAQLYDESFAEFGARDDLPQFDYIGLHGIWSWISDENRAIVVDFIRRKLKVGGVLYISYNTQPGWSSFAPIRHLMTQHAELMGAPAEGIVSRIDGALAFTDQLLATNPLYSRVNPQAISRFEKLKEQNRQYLAHEYFNRDWHPMHFATMAQWLEPAKLSFACSAHLHDHIEVINLTAEQRTFIAGLADAGLRQTTRDFMVNQQFRRDYWVKGARRLTPLEQAEGLRKVRLVLITHRGAVPTKVNGSLGEAALTASIYDPILDFMADHQIRTIGEIERVAAAKQISFAVVIEVVMVLAGAGHLAVAQDDPVIVKARKVTERLNSHLIHKARGAAEVNHLASPVIGGGVQVGRFQQLFILARQQGHKSPQELASFVWAILGGQGQRISKAGAVLATTEENLAELTQEAERFNTQMLPVLKALLVA